MTSTQNNCGLLGLIALFLCHSLSGQISSTNISSTYEDAHGQAKAIAEEAWSDNKKTIRDVDLAAFGFKSTAQLSAAKLGDPIPIFTLQQFSLTDYDNNKSVLTLLSPSLEIKYPILSDGVPVSAISVVKVDGRWIPGVLGDRHTTALLRKALSSAQGASEYLIAAEVPALHKFLIVESSPTAAIRAVIDADGRETVLFPSLISNFQWDAVAEIYIPSPSGACADCRNLTTRSGLVGKSASVLSGLADEVRSLKAPSN
jgi:hypothetical protein